MKIAIGRMRDDTHKLISDAKMFEAKSASETSISAGGIDKCIAVDVAGHLPGTSWVHYTTSCNTQSSAHEDGQNNWPKHVELTGIINNPLLLHLVGCLHYLYQ
jgi:hypothetical protein